MAKLFDNREKNTNRNKMKKIISSPFNIFRRQSIIWWSIIINWSQQMKQYDSEARPIRHRCAAKQFKSVKCRKFAAVWPLGCAGLS